jgi:hypothetical protein
MANLDSVRGIHLQNCTQNWSALTKIRSLQTLFLCYSYSYLRDSSPLLNDLDGPWFGRYDQEWRRTGEDKFNLIKLQTSGKVDGKLILSEPHLQELDLRFHPTLKLPTDSTTRPLRVTLRAEDQHNLPFEILSSSFVRSLVLDLRPNTPFDLPSLSLSNLRSLEVLHTAVESISQALTRSKPKFLTSLKLGSPLGVFKPLALALPECPSLTNLVITEDQNFGRDVLRLALVLHDLPLTHLTLDLRAFINDAIESLLSLTALQDLKLGTLIPKQLRLVADALPSLSSLQNLELDTVGFTRCEHESAQLALFSALSSSSLRSLSLYSSVFRIATLEACLNKIPNTQLTLFQLWGSVYADGFDPSLHDSSYPQVHSTDLQLDWHLRFPEAKDRFCLLKIFV